MEIQKKKKKKKKKKKTPRIHSKNQLQLKEIGGQHLNYLLQDWFLSNIYIYIYIYIYMREEERERGREKQNKKRGWERLDSRIKVRF